MPHDLQSKQIIIIDRQNHWGDLSEEALKSEGVNVHLSRSYEYPPPGSRIQNPDLVILSCTSIGNEELKLAEKILSLNHHLTVLSPSLPRNVMRKLFLIGADDVTDRPYGANDLIELVDEILQNIETRDSYEVAKRKKLPWTIKDAF